MLLPDGWEEKVSGIKWVAYSPPSADPNAGLEATSNAIIDDLAVLREAGFTGLVTYSSAGRLGNELPVLAKSAGFQGLIMGIWDPINQEELTAAESASKNSIVLGFCVGNEGLHKRYETAELSAALENLRLATGKPVTTTEEIDDYSDEELLFLGDWVFPNAHPYFHGRLDPEAAVRWTTGAYEDLKTKTDRFILFKEVGLPTAGDPDGKLTESSQEKYYLELEKTNVLFVYFEAFDQPWKTNLQVEPHWGIFLSDRTPKLFGWRLMGKMPTPSPTPMKDFYIYQDADSPDNHFKPTGYMGDTGDIHINEMYEENPHSGQTSIRVLYDALGKGPNECLYNPPCNWAGVYWQEPPNNWGQTEAFKGKGFNLTGFTSLKFWSRAESSCSIEFLVGGIDEKYGDSLKYPRTKNVILQKTWQEFEIDLFGADLTYIIGGFAWSSSKEKNPEGCTFYLDDIRYQ
jgi:exo-beta-1,3-glucanase (GH17 family)